MNNTFSIKRFGLLLRKHWLEKRKVYLAGWAIYTIAILAFYVLTLLNAFESNLNRDAQVGVYFTVLFAGGIIYAGLMFNDYSRKESGLFNLLLPASHLEKALVCVFFGVIFFWIAINSSFMLIDIPFTLLNRDETATPFFPLCPRRDDSIDIIIFQIVYLFGQTLFVLGAVYFRRLAFFKTAVAVFVLLLITVYIVTNIVVGDYYVKYRIIKMIDTDSDHNTSDTYVIYTDKIAEFSTAVTWMIFGMGILIYLGFCYVISLRLKEKQM